MDAGAQGAAIEAEDSGSPVLAAHLPMGKCQNESRAYKILFSIEGWNFLHAAKPKPVRAIDGIFGGPATSHPDKSCRAQKATAPHRQAAFKPLTFAHFPNITAHVIAPIGADPAVKQAYFRCMLQI